MMSIRSDQDKPVTNPMRLAVLFSSGLGVGYLPWASGTFGTLWGLLLYYLGRSLHWQLFAVGTLLLIFLSLYLSHYAEKALGSHDSSIIVIDEIVGYLVAVVGISFSFPHAVGAFVLFRVFDIWKPFPIRAIDRQWPGAWGVIMDDVLAGIFANLCLHLILYAWGKI
jgi:phosphatidylglycerophosphatase A